MAETKETIILELRIDDGSGGKAMKDATKEVEVLATSIVGLQKENKKLREERNKVDTSTEAGIKKIKELNATIDKNNETIKENSSSLEKQRLNVGNYSSALDKLFPGLGGVISKLTDMSQASGGVIGGIKGMIKSSLAFIATPIGAILAGLVLVLGLVTKFFKGSEEGADKFAKVSAQVSAIVGVVTDRLIQLGGALVAFLTGDFEGGLNKLEGAFSGVGDEIQREIDLAAELADMLDELEERELRYSIAVSESVNAIKKLIIESKNRTLTEQQRIDKLTEASDKEIALNKELIKIQEDRIDATARQIQADFSQLQSEKKAGESAIEFAKRIVANESILIDKRTELAELIKKYNEAQGDSLNLQEKIQNQQDALYKKQIERIQKINEEELKMSEEAREARIAKVEQEWEWRRQQYINHLAFIETFNQDVEIKTAQSIARVAKIRDEQTKRQIKNEQDAAEKQRKIEDYKNQAIIGGIELVTKEKSAARIALSTIFKADAIRETIINTYNAAVAAYKSLAGIPYIGPVLGAAAAAAVAVFGGVSVAKMAGVQFAKGGRADKQGMFNGPSHANGGINYIREDGGHKINVEGGENFYVLKKSASREINSLSSLNKKHGGVAWEPLGTYPTVKYATGGQVVAQNTPPNTSNIERVVKSVMENMPPIYTTVQDINDGQARVARIVDGSELL
jgi:septal ring factor EnvC (AmiA/AmiB activator)